MKRYFGVIYLKNGDACVSRACDSEEQCVDAMKRAVAREYDKIKATTYMMRDVDEGSDAEVFMFGHPRTRDLMQDRKFLKELF